MSEAEMSPPVEREKFVLLREPWLQMILFLATVCSTMFAGALITPGEHPLRGWRYSLPLLAILVTHEFGHYLQARRHRVDASLPYFLPLPLPPLGTLGAVISMRGKINSRDALLDIGASGPIAGLIIAIPVLVLGLKLSPIEPLPLHGQEEGQSLLYLAMKYIVLGPIPDGYDVMLHPTAFAGWAGLFMTMLNLIPVGQLDGGHVAYSLFGPKQNRYSRFIHRSLPVVALVVGIFWAMRALRSHAPWANVGSAMFEGWNWLVWFVLLGFLGRMTGADEHPPTEDEILSPKRRLVAWLTLAAFVALFMPVPFRNY